jgi:hypothetical protein
MGKEGLFAILIAYARNARESDAFFVDEFGQEDIKER